MRNKRGGALQARGGPFPLGILGAARGWGGGPMPAYITRGPGGRTPAVPIISPVLRVYPIFYILTPQKHVIFFVKNFFPTFFWGFSFRGPFRWCSLQVYRGPPAPFSTSAGSSSSSSSCSSSKSALRLSKRPEPFRQALGAYPSWDTSLSSGRRLTNISASWPANTAAFSASALATSSSSYYPTTKSSARLFAETTSPTDRNPSSRTSSAATVSPQNINIKFQIFIYTYNPIFNRKFWKSQNIDLIFLLITTISTAL